MIDLSNFKTLSIASHVLKQLAINGKVVWSGEQESPDEWFTWSDDGTTATVTGLTTLGQQQHEFVIPTEHNNLPVKTIGNSAFSYKSNIQKIAGKSIETLGSYAFANCSSLITVSFPACTTIESFAFQNCSKLKTISIPAATTIGSNVFQNCNDLILVDISDSTQAQIDSMANIPWGGGNAGISNAYFYIAAKDGILETQKKGYKIGSDWIDVRTENSYFDFSDNGDHYSITGVKSSASTLSSLYPVQFYRAKEVTEVKPRAFANLTAVTEIDLCDIEKIGADAFVGCTSLQNVYLAQFSMDEIIALDDFGWGITDSSVKIWGYDGYVDYQGNKTTYVTPDSHFTWTTSSSAATVTGLQDNGITDKVLVIPETYNGLPVTTLNTNSLRQQNTVKKYKSLYSKSVTTVGNTVFTSNIQLKKICIPEALSIGSECLYGIGCKEIKFEKVTSIGNYSYNISILKKLVLNSISNFGSQQFLGCVFLKDVYTNNYNFNSNVFTNCNSLENVYSLQNTISIADIVLLPMFPWDCPSDKAKFWGNDGWVDKNKVLHFTESPMEWFTFTDDGTNATVTGLQGDGLEATSIIIPIEYNGMPVKYIGANAFENNTNLQGVTTTSVTSIGNSAFSGCSNLATYFMPEVLSIGTSAFAGTKIAKVDFPKATSIGASAFSNCSQLTTINLPLTNSYASKLFENCNRLSAYLDLGTKTLASDTFSGVTSVKEVFINKTMTQIAADTNFPYGFSSATYINGTDGWVESDGTTHASNSPICWYNFNSAHTEITGVKDGISWPQNLVLPDTYYDGTTINSMRGTFQNIYPSTIKTVTGNNIETLGSYSVRGSNVESVDFQNATSLNSAYVFGFTSKLNTVNIPKAETIASNAFQYAGINYNVDKINITDKSMAEIKAMANFPFGAGANSHFYGDDGYVDQNGTEHPYHSPDNYFTWRDDETHYTVTGLDTAGLTATSIDIPAIHNHKAVTSIGSGAFINNDNLESVKIDSHITEIGLNAFSDSDNIASIEMKWATMSEVKAMTNFSWGINTTAKIICKDGWVDYQGTEHEYEYVSVKPDATSTLGSGAIKSGINYTFPNEATYSLWFKSDSDTTRSPFFTIENTIGGQGGVAYGIAGPGNTYYDQQGNYVHALYDGHYETTVRFPELDTNWHQYTFTYKKGTGTKIYIDGIQKSSYFRDTSINVSNGEIRLGYRKQISGQIEQGGGLITRVCMWDRELTAAEILADYQARSDEPSSTSLVHYWPMIENLNDSVGDWDLQLQNNATLDSDTPWTNS